MRYYVYYDAYGHSRKAIGEEELAARYNGDLEAFRRAMADAGQAGDVGRASGHVGIVSSEKEIAPDESPDITGEEITGFFECKADSRPYNF